MTRALLKQALVALEYHKQQTRPIHNTELAIEALRDELAKPAPAPEHDVHPDDKAVDRFAGRMKWKLANARAKGKSGWQDRSWTPDQISAALRQHVDKGDPTDVANYCMFLAARGEPITLATAPEQPVEQQAPQMAQPDNLEQIIDDYVDDYVMEGDDGTYRPTESEKCLIKDAVMGLLADPEWNSAWGKIVGGSKQALYIVPPEIIVFECEHRIEPEDTK
mgnify:CR=1 FL=1